MKTIPNLFIIESVSFEDEKGGLFEGQFLSDILNLGGKETIYYYIRTKAELIAVLDIFYESKYRYLHFSCHGGNSAIHTTLDEITFLEFGDLVEFCLLKRRLFLSACSVVNRNFALEVIPRSGCWSVIGPTKDIYFDDAAIFWASFYHLVFEIEQARMTRKAILKASVKAQLTFGLDMTYYSASKSGKDNIKGGVLTSTKLMDKFKYPDFDKLI